MPRQWVFSANSLKSWARCRRQFELNYIKRLDWSGPTGHFELGLTVHRLMEEAAKGHDILPILQDLPEKTRRFAEALRQNRWAQLPVVASEWEFNVKVGGQWLTGRLDRIARDGDNLIIVDWKTGTSAPKDPLADWQTRLYLYALHQTAQRQLNISVTPDQMAFVYLQVSDQPDGTPEVKEFIVPYSTALHAEITAQLDQTVGDIMTATQFPLPDACPDNYCLYRHVCGIEAIEAA